MAESYSNRAKVERQYKKAGLETRYIEDTPGTVYESHRHGSVILYTLNGSARIKLDDQEWFTTRAGDEVSIGHNQRHEAVVGAEGWSYIFAATADEMKRQGL